MGSTSEISSSPSWKFWHNRRRYVITILIFLGTSIMYIMRTNLSVAIVSMTSEKTGQFDWNSKQQGFVLSSFFYGYIITQLPGGIVAKHFPAHHVFGFAIGICALLTLLTPILVMNYVTMIVIRVVEGLVLGVTFPAMMGILSRWSPVMERSRMTMICNAGVYFGTVTAMSGAGVLSDFYGWESVFYVSGAIGIIFFVVWILAVKESPENDPWISDAEQKYIMEGLKTQQCKSGIKTPWLALLTSIPVWAIVFAHFAQNWGAYTLMTQMPTFLSDTINLHLSSNGFYSALPYIATGLVAFPAGLVSDLLQKRKILKTVYVRKLFTSGAFILQCVFMLCAGYIMNPTGSITFLTIAMGLGSISMSGYGINFIDIAPQFSSIIFGFSNTIATVPGIISPIIKGFIVQNKVNAGYALFLNTS